MTVPSLHEWVPDQQFRDDATGALTLLVDQVLQPTLVDYWGDADGFGNQNDPDLALPNAVEAMLLDLGCPFPSAFDLPTNQQRALVKALLIAYRQFGTVPSVIDMVLALTGLVVTAVISPAQLDGWFLGISVLGEPGETYDPAYNDLTVLGQSSSNAYSFQLQMAVPPTADQEALIRAIVAVLKPAHTHFVGFVSSTPPPSAWILGESELGFPNGTDLGPGFQAPAFTSANDVTFQVGNPGTFDVVVYGVPNSTITKSGALPTGVTFVDGGSDVAILSGTPAAGTAGTYALVLNAANGVNPQANQTFTLIVNP